MTEYGREDREVNDLLRVLDEPLPEISARDVIRRATRGRRIARLRWAAGVVLALGVASALYALPGSPLRAWVDRLVAATGAAGPDAGDPGQRSDAGGPGGGLTFDPAEPLVLEIASGGGGHLRIRPTAAGELTVRMLSGAGRFTSDPARLGVRLESSDTLEVAVPDDARSVVARHGATTLFDKRGDVVTAAVPPDSDGVYAFDLTGDEP